MSVHHDRLIESMLNSLETGCPVFTSDGEEIGTLAEVTPTAIKINAPMKRDFWVKTDFVLSCEPQRVDLGFAKRDVAAYAMDDAGSRDDPMVEQKADLITGEHEQLETRIRMEQELAQQRRELPHLHPRGDDGPPDTFGTLGEPVESELSRLNVPVRPSTDGRAEIYGVREHGRGGGARTRRWLTWMFAGVAAGGFAAITWLYMRRR